MIVICDTLTLSIFDVDLGLLLEQLVRDALLVLLQSCQLLFVVAWLVIWRGRR